MPFTSSLKTPGDHNLLGQANFLTGGSDPTQVAYTPLSSISVRALLQLKTLYRHTSPNISAVSNVGTRPTTAYIVQLYMSNLQNLHGISNIVRTSPVQLRSFLARYDLFPYQTFFSGVCSNHPSDRGCSACLHNLWRCASRPKK